MKPTSHILSLDGVFWTNCESLEGAFLQIWEDFETKMKLINKKTSILKNFKTFPDKIIRIDLPQLPDYNWEINKDIINKEIMFNQYFVS